MRILQIKSSVPSSWKIKLKQCTMRLANILTGNRIFINNKNTFIEKNIMQGLLLAYYKYKYIYTNF